NPKIKFMWNSVVADIKGGKKIADVIVKDINNKKEQTISVGGLFVTIGLHAFYSGKEAIEVIH
ncbi:MAG TPA: hypothetical protein VI278_14170, partial [Nitrososphaeraceae archaeon]